MKKILFFLLFTACGQEEPTYITDLGIYVYCESDTACYKKEHVEIAYDIAIDKYSEQDNVSKRKIHKRFENDKGWHELIIVKDILEFDGQKATGLTYSYGGSTIKLTHISDCVSSSALDHEIIHQLLGIFSADGYTGGDHANERYWKAACTKNYDNYDERLACDNSSLEGKISKEFRETMKNLDESCAW